MPEFSNRADAKRQARALLQTAQVSPKAMTALFCGISLLLNVLSSAVPEPEMVSVFFTYLADLAGWVLTAGFVLYCMGIRRRERVELATLFDGFSFAGKIIILNVLTTLFTALWSMLFVIPGVIAHYRYRFALYTLCEDPSIGVLEAIACSKRQTNGWKMHLFNLDMSYLGWFLLSILPVFVFCFSALFGPEADLQAFLYDSTPLWQILTAEVWSCAVSLFYLPNYQCVTLAYFDAAKETSRVSGFDRT